MTQQIQERVERETGYKLTINGGTRIGLWPSLNVTLNDVTLQDPKDRDTSNRLTAGSIQADVTLASVWAGRPKITELMIVRPVLNVPLQRERVKDSNPAPKSVHRRHRRRLYDRACQRHRRHHRVCQSARPRREQDRDHQRRRHHRWRPQNSRGRQCAHRRADAEIRHQGRAARRRRSSGRIFRPNSRSTRRPSCRRSCRARRKSASTARW